MSVAGLSDYHLHTPLCRHAQGWPVDLARRAVDLGLSEIGFADHSPMPAAFDDWRMLREEMPDYLDAVEEARRAYPKLPIRLGLEVDFFPDGAVWWEELRAMAPWDYWIGSVHYLPDGMEIDNPKYISRYREADPELVWSAYWKAYEECIRSGWFEFVAHPDLPKKFGFRPRGDLRRFYEPAVQALVDTGIAYELNTAGLRKDCRELYPAFEFVQMACAAGVPVLINSDAHAPGEVGAGFEEALRCLRLAGYTELVRFTGGERFAVALPSES